jgi:epoxyqueuosine reductase
MIKAKLETEANRLGFKYVGFAPSQSPPHFPQFTAWVKRGFHGDMGYLSRPDAQAKRGDSGLILPECKTIISLAMPYAPPGNLEGRTPSPGQGRISAYARTPDYHEIIWEKLSQLEAYLQQITDQEFQSQSYVDTGPVLEREFAALAGLGAPGKNSCLIIPGAGSYFFLAEILTTLSLPFDAPFEADLCKNCTRCIEACPTQCILPDRTVNATRCISYLTIENKGSIPENLRESIGAWFFGCDICQMVCPHNRAQENKGGQIPSGELVLPEWIPMMDLFNDQQTAVLSQFEGTPLTRAKRRGLLRNAAIVLGNTGESSLAIQIKKIILKEEDDIVKEALIWAHNAIKQRERGS